MPRFGILPIYDIAALLFCSVFFVCSPVSFFRGFAQTTVAEKPGEITVKNTDLSEALIAFKRGDFPTANSLVVKIDLPTLPVEQKRDALLLHMRLAVVYGRTDEMKFRLKQLSELPLTVTLDPLQDPPAAIEYWQSLHSKPENSEPSSPSAREASSIPKPRNRIFWMSLLPLGLGHYESGRFLEGFGYLGGYSALVLSTAKLNESDEEAQSYCARYEAEDCHAGRVGFSPNLAAVLGFTGLYGHEIVGMLPELTQASPENAKWVRTSLSFFPFGVGQRKNGQILKAWGFGAFQAVTIVTPSLVWVPGLAPWSYLLLFTSLIYGAVDGYVNEPVFTQAQNAHHKDKQRGSESQEQTLLSRIDFSLMPTTPGTFEENKVHNRKQKNAQPLGLRGDFVFRF